MPRYRYELREDDGVIATGHLERQEPFELGECVDISGRSGLVRAVEPLLGEAERRLVVQLPRDPTPR